MIDLELADRVFSLKVKGIAPEPKVIYPNFERVSVRIIVGRALLPINAADSPDLTYWSQQ